MIKDLASFDLGATNLNRATFDYLRSLEWIPLKRNAALVGPPGTGKTHLAISLGRAAIDAGYQIYPTGQQRRVAPATSRYLEAAPRAQLRQPELQHAFANPLDHLGS